MSRDIEGWQRCTRCHRLIYTGVLASICWDGRPHDVTGSRHYLLTLSWQPAEGAQGGWDRCERCACLFFTENPTLGRCTPEGDVHVWSVNKARHFVWNMGGAADDPNWKWCNRCESLCDSTELGGVTCWDGQPHNLNDSGDYYVSVLPHPRRRLHGLLLRPGDQTVLGVEWTAMESVVGAAGTVVARGPGRLTLTVPPQHVTESPVIWSSLDAPLEQGMGDVPPGAGIAFPDGDYPGGPIVIPGGGDLLIGSEVVGGRSFPPGAPVAVGGTEVFAVDVDGYLCRMAEGFWSVVGDDQRLFQPGAHVAAETSPEGGVAAYIARDDQCVAYVDGRGWQRPVSLPVPGASFAPARAGMVGIACVENDRIVRQLFEGGAGGEGWTRSEGEPCPYQLEQGQPLASLSLADWEQGQLYAVSDHEGTAWIYDWDARRWSPLDSSAAPAGHLAMVIDRSGAGVPLWLVGVDAYGSLTATGVTTDGNGWQAVNNYETRYFPQVGDWCPPGAPVAAYSSETSTRVFSVGGDRTVRFASRVGGVWNPVLPESADPDEERPLWRAAGTGLAQSAAQAGPSRVTVAVEDGEQLGLSAEAVLGLVNGRTLLNPDDAHPVGTSLEVPWGLWLQVEPDAARMSHEAGPRVSPRGDVAVWRSVLTPGLALDAVTARTDREFDDNEPPWAPRPAVEADTRFSLLSSPLITADRLELSTLGAWLSAHGNWGDGSWSQDVVCGRDVRIDVERRGILLPFGHPATYRVSVERRFDPRPDRTTAILHLTASLEVTRPLLAFPAAETTASRGFPFTEVEVLQAEYDGIDQADWMVGEGDPSFRPGIRGVPIQVPVALRRGAYAAVVALPVIFSESGDTAAGASAEAWAAASVDLSLGGGPVPLVGDSLFDTQSLRIESGVHPETGRAQPRVAAARIRVPALEALGQPPQVYAATFGPAWLDSGDSALALVIPEQTVDFASRSDRSGGVATPSFRTDVVSAAGGLAQQAMGEFDPRTFFQGLDAKLLGMVSLPEVVQELAEPPVITSLVAPGDHLPRTTYTWQGVPLRSAPGFEVGADARLSLLVECAVEAGGRPPRTHTEGSITNFSLGLAGVLRASFQKLTFTADAGQSPTLAVEGFELGFAGDLSFLDILTAAMAELSIEPPVAVETAGNAITLSQQIALPELSLGAGAFSVTLRGAVFSSRMVLPFDGALELDLSFGTRQQPFLVGVWILGGGGYLELKIRDGELVSLVAGVELGGLWSFDWLVVAGEVHALAGIRIEVVEGFPRLSGYLRVGGSVEVLGLISVGIEMAAEITAGENAAGRFQVTAAVRIVVEVDLFLVSAEVDLEQEVLIYEAPEEALPGPVAGGVADPRADWDAHSAAYARQG